MEGRKEGRTKRAGMGLRLVLKKGNTYKEGEKKREGIGGRDREGRGRHDLACVCWGQATKAT
jgi:hypothetical protein